MRAKIIPREEWAVFKPTTWEEATGYTLEELEERARALKETKQ